jgi:hypothetical protein
MRAQKQSIRRGIRKSEYLVGYDSTNKYRIWNPKLNKIISTRDVVFDEDSCFNGDITSLKDDLLLNELAESLERFESSNRGEINEPDTVDTNEDESVGFDIIDD